MFLFYSLKMLIIIKTSYNSADFTQHDSIFS